jgi:hypothetical protein
MSTEAAVYGTTPRALVMASPFTAAAAAVAREKSGGVKDKKWPRV